MIALLLRKNEWRAGTAVPELRDTIERGESEKHIKNLLRAAELNPES